ncbi:MAG TPA: hypothetical protein VN256_11355 [Pyrinomonadaceae bacterium]|nr:hypothetical protein [Pyrinomonadaceae bacterium]
MAKQIIWFDNDPAYINPYVNALAEEGYGVYVAETVTEAEEALTANRYDLLILDAMIPTKNEEEEEKFPPEETDRGLKMGLIFYKHWKEALDRAGTRVLAITVRIDETIQNEFMKLGLPPEGFARKTKIKRVQDVMQRVKALIGDAQSG